MVGRNPCPLGPPRQPALVSPTTELSVAGRSEGAMVPTGPVPSPEHVAAAHGVPCGGGLKRARTDSTSRARLYAIERTAAACSLPGHLVQPRARGKGCDSCGRRLVQEPYGTGVWTEEVHVEAGDATSLDDLAPPGTRPSLLAAHEHHQVLAGGRYTSRTKASPVPTASESSDDGSSDASSLVSEQRSVHR